MDILHDQPIDGLFIISIDSCSFDKLCLESNDGVRLVVGIDLKVVSNACLTVLVGTKIDLDLRWTESV